MPLPLAPFVVSAAAGLARSAIGALAGPGQKAQAVDPKAKKTADDFERMFLEQSLERMFSSVGDDGPLGDNGTGGPIYRSMLVNEYAGNIVRSGGVGISAQVYGEIMRLQEGNHG
jgi:peptidoglycan hydrolase FlgJ